MDDHDTTVIDGDIYSLDGLDAPGAPHPGGHIIDACRGVDATALFAMHHGPDSRAHACLRQQQQRLGRAANGSTRKSEFYEELSRRVHRRVGGAPLEAARRVVRAKAALLLAAIAVLATAHSAGHLAATAVLPYFYYMFAAQIMHEAGHAGAGGYNRAMRAAAACLGVGGTPRWVYKHLRHHAVTNHAEDPELSVNSLLRLHAGQPLRRHHRYMPYYVPLLYAALHLDMFVENLMPQPARVRGARIHTRGAWFESHVARFVFAALHVALPLALGGGVRAVLAELVCFCPASLLISLLFQVSHVTDATAHRVGRRADPAEDWALAQMRDSRDYAPHSSWMTHLTGGLNLQAEHHLFPAMPHPLLPAVREELVALCAERGIACPPAYPTFAEAVRAHYRVIVARSSS